MDSTNRGDLRINGSGSAGGGTYDSVVIRGSGKITGDLKCTAFSISGSGTIEGSLETSDGRISGSGAVEGSVKADRFKISGSGRIEGDLKTKEYAVSGSGTVGKSVEATLVKLEGTAKIGENCSAETFTADGGFEVGGLLSADDVNIRLYGFKSRAREIGGGKIIVSLGPPTGFFKSLFAGLIHPVLEADTIEGDEIVLENTTARIVRGNTVIIGSGCDIGTVEYKEFCQKNLDAKVGTETKI